MNAGPQRHRLHALLRVGVVAVIGVGLVGVWLGSSPWRVSLPPGEPAAVLSSTDSASTALGSANGEGAGPGSVAGDMLADAPTRERLETGVRGRFLDAAGEPLVGWAMQLRRRRAAVTPRPSSPPRLQLSSTQMPDHALETQRTGADGHFEFVGLLPAEYEVRSRDWSATAISVRVESGTCTEVELRLPDDVVAVTGTLLQHGKIDEEHWVHFVQDGEQVLTRSFDPGGMRCVLRPGRYQVRVPASFQAYLSVHDLFVAKGPPRMSWAFEVGGIDVEVVVRVLGRRSGVTFGVDCNGEAAIGGETELLFAGNGNLQQPAHLLLPPGSWRIHVHASNLLAMAERVVVLDNTTPTVRLEFDAMPAGIVELTLRDRRGRSPTYARDLLPPLLVAGREYACRRGNSPGFDSVPLGVAELRLEDRLVDGSMVFLPFEPQSPVSLVTVEGSPSQIALDIERRAFVDIRACVASGREDGNACVEVFAGEHRVRGRIETYSQRWAAWLPAGTYRVVIDRAGVVREHEVVVARADLLLRLRP